MEGITLHAATTADVPSIRDIHEQGLVDGRWVDTILMEKLFDER
jgi:hypothetical protein